MLPVLFTVPGLGWEIHAYGLMLAVALLVGWAVVRALARADRLPTATLGTAYVLGVGLGLVAARLAWLLQRPGESDGGPVFALDGDGLAPFAGMFVAAVVGGYHLMRRRVPVVAGYDVAAPAFAAGAIVEHLGALLAGTSYGDYAPTLPWAITFPPGSPAAIEHHRSLATLLPPGTEGSLPVHPVQIYGMLIAGGVLAVALWLRKRRRYSGQVFLGTAIAYLVGRTLLEEWFRADALPAKVGPFNGGQIGAIVLIASMAVIAWARGRLADKNPAAFRPWEGGRWSPAGRGSSSGGSGRSGSEAASAGRREATGSRAATSTSSAGKGTGKGGSKKHSKGRKGTSRNKKRKR